MTVRWAELCAGSGATTLQLLGGSRAAPVVTWMGGKRRLAAPILAAMGLDLRDPRVEGVLLADAGPWGWVWPALLDPRLAGEVAAVLRGWEGEDPQDLWRRLAAAPPADAVSVRAAGWLWLQGRSAPGVPLWWSSEHDGWRMGPEAARQRASGKPARQKGLNAAGAGGIMSPATVGRRVDDVAAMVATWLCLQAGGWQGRPVTVTPERWVTHGYARPSREAEAKAGPCWSPTTVRRRVQSIPRAPGWHVYHGDAGDLLDLLLGWATHVYIDPPYVGRTGYGWDLRRDRLLDLVTTLAAAGIVVAVSEAEPLDLPGWHHVDLTGCARKGSSAEWLTLSAAPAEVPAEQLALGW